MRLVVLTAGRATRLGNAAPHGCKALTPLGGRPAIEWQIEAAQADTVTVVCRTLHAALLATYGDIVTDDSCRGAGRALHHVDLDGPVVVAYADTFFTALPEGTDWCGVHNAPGGRYWDVAGPMVLYRYVRPDQTADICVGLYRFDDPDRLDRALRTAGRLQNDEVGMAPVINRYRPLDFVPVPSWQDIGDRDALERFALPKVPA